MLAKSQVKRLLRTAKCREPLGGDPCGGVVGGGGRRSTVLAGLYEGGLGSGNWGVRYEVNNPIETKEGHKTGETALSFLSYIYF
jgi:hypothetical protein